MKSHCCSPLPASSSRRTMSRANGSTAGAEDAARLVPASRLADRQAFHPAAQAEARPDGEVPDRSSHHAPQGSARSEGNAVRDALHTLGFKPVKDVHIG